MGFSEQLRSSLLEYKELLDAEAMERFLKLEQEMSRVVDKDQEEYKRLQREIKQAFREMIGLKEGEVVQDEQEVAERVLKVHQKAAAST